MTQAPLHFLRGLALALVVAQAAQALPSRPADQVRVFAICAGRLSALATRQRSFNEPGAAENQRLSALFDTLLEATLPDALAAGIADRQPRRWRYHGWREMALLLADVDHSLDPRRVDRARQTLQTRIATCRDLLL